MVILFSRPKIVRYPTGYKTRRWELKSPTGRIRIEIEQTLRFATGWKGAVGEEIGDYVLSGSCIPLGAKGVIAHETLPVRVFHARVYGDAGALRAAKDMACKWYRQLMPECEPESKTSART